MRILIVEDEIRLALALAELLHKEKYSVDTVHNGISGLDYAQSNVYDAIILDIMLPKLNGIDVLKNIRAEKIHTPIILLTAKDDISDKVSGLDHGADDYLTKPFSTDELLARLRVLLRRKGELLDKRIAFHDLSLDTSTAELCCDVTCLKLGLKEFQIMEFLILNGKQIITKEKFIEKIWGFDSDTEYNNVEVYISFLRKKLLYINSNTEIRTVRGLGYCLEVRDV